MENMFIAYKGSKLFGLYTDHQKAVEGIVTYAFSFSYKMVQYNKEPGIEFFMFKSDAGFEEIYELHEITPNSRV